MKTLKTGFLTQPESATEAFRLKGLLKAALPFVYMAAFCASVWGAKFHPSIAHASMTVQVSALLALMALFTVPYLFLLNSNRNAFGNHGWISGAIAVFLGCILTPSFLETDQFRYIWDGLVAANGMNPFSFAPDEHASRAAHFWAMHINHPYLSTIYPPFSQAMFQLSTYFNPFFWHNELGWGIGPASGVDSFFKAEFGLKVMFGMLMAALLWLIRGHRWDLFVFHPLFLVHVISNSHVDALMLPGLALITTATLVRKPTLSLLGWLSALLAKWLPLVFLPLFAFRIWQKQGWVGVTTNLGLGVAIVAMACLFYIHGSEGGFLESTFVYGETWYFFGYMHRFIADFIGLLSLSAEPVQTAKLIAVPFILIGGGVSFLFYLKGAFSFRLAAAFTILSVLMFFPTLHPWYLLSLLFLGLRHMRLIRIFWVWPLLSLLSHTFYLKMADPYWVRYGVYFIVTLCLFLDLKRLYPQMRMALRFEKRSLLSLSSLRGR